MTALLFRHEQINQTGIPKSKSDRLSVTGNCSLGIKKVTEEDAGRYTCRQQALDFFVLLSVVTSEYIICSNAEEDIQALL